MSILHMMAAVFAIPQLTVVCIPDNVSGVGDIDTGYGDTDTATANVSGGVDPGSIVWTKVSGDTFTVLPSNTDFAVYFQGTTGQSATYRATVTDGLGRTATADVAVSIS